MALYGEAKQLVTALCKIPTRERLMAELKAWREVGPLTRTERYCFGQAAHSYKQTAQRAQRGGQL